MSETSKPRAGENLPQNLEAEAFIFGAILIDNAGYAAVAAIIRESDFNLEKHRRLWRRMTELNDRGEAIDRVTLANELMRYGELESVGGMGYLAELDTGMPAVYNLASYARIVKDKSVLRELIFASQNVINRAMAAEEAPAQLVSSSQDTFLAIQSRENASAAFASPVQIMQGFEGGINAFLDPSSQARGVPTGFTRFDEMTNGLHPGELFILAARPSVGKSAMALNMLVSIARAVPDKAAALISMEMSGESLMHRLICAEARVDSQKFRLGYLDQEERGRLSLASHQIAQLPIRINDQAGTTLPQVLSALRRLKAEEGLSVAIVDYLQLMEAPRSENRNVAVGMISRGLKRASVDLGIPIIALSQLSRAPELRKGSSRPILSDLRESGSIEQDADLVAFIYRPELYHRDREDLRGVTELILAKQRNGPVGTIQLIWLSHLTRFENRLYEDGAEETQPEPAVRVGGAGGRGRRRRGQEQPEQD